MQESLTEVMNLDFNHEIPLGLELINLLPLHMSAGIYGEIDESPLNLLELSCQNWGVKNQTSEEVLALIKSSFQDENEGLERLEPSLRIIAHNNIGVLNFCNDQPQRALEHFDKASLLLEIFSSLVTYLPMGYLKIAILLNQTRTCIRLNKLKTALNLIVKMRSHAEALDLVATEMLVLYTRSKFLCLCSELYVRGLYHHRSGEHQKALGYYNQMLAHTKNELGNDHIYTASVLEKIGNALFDQKKYQTSMLSYLASLRVYEKLSTSKKNDDSKPFGATRSRILYAIGRTYHDQENLVDALSCYLKALTCRGAKIESIRILCNIERIHRAFGDLPKALETNLRIIKTASMMLGGEEESSMHPFVQSQHKTLGNLYIEMDKPDEAMESFSKVRRVSDSKGEGNVTKASSNILKSAEFLCKTRRDTKRHAAAA